MHTSLAGLSFTLAVPMACVARSRRLPATLTSSGAGKGYRAISFSYYVGRGKRHRERVGKHSIVVYAPTLATSHAGRVNLPLGGSKAGTNTLKVVIALRSTKHHRIPKNKTLKLTPTLSFSIC
ncbi:MAG: hypothetical protein JO304_19730 [Solirubrobacterales bacterium]|nr:hypothetical protein [Solirubrobacterales bacterium]